MFLKYNWPWMVWAIAIIVLLTIPGDNLPEPLFGIKYVDKIGHFGIFFVLILLMIFGLKKQYSYLKLRSFSIVLALSFGLFWAILSEIVQIFAEQRSFEYADILADSFGLLMGAALLYIYKERIILSNNKKC